MNAPADTRSEDSHSIILSFFCGGVEYHANPTTSYVNPVVWGNIANHSSLSYVYFRKFAAE